MVEPASVGDITEASIYQRYRAPKTYLKLQYCVSCAIHGRIVRVRSRQDRRVRTPPKRQIKKTPRPQQPQQQAAKPNPEAQSTAAPRAAAPRNAPQNVFKSF